MNSNFDNLRLRSTYKASQEIFYILFITLGHFLLKFVIFIKFKICQVCLKELRKIFRAGKVRELLSSELSI